MNVIIVSPNFPACNVHFCTRLQAAGVNVLGIGDGYYDNFGPELRYGLTEYYHVDDIGAAIAKGVCKADGKKYIEEEKTEPADVFYRVQVGAFNEKSNADNLAKKLEKAGYDALVVTVKQDSKVFYRVQVGAFNEKANADALAKRLENDGYDTIVVEVKR